MDLLDFEGQDLYFDEPLPAEIERLIKIAADTYGTPGAEANLLQAFFLSPDNLTVLVALYRYYYYTHQYEKALTIASHAMKFSGQHIGFPAHWQDLTMADIGHGAIQSMAMVRFYLLALKAAGYLKLRVHDFKTAQAMLNKVVELDTSDRLGATPLLAMANEQVIESNTESAIRASGC